MKIGELSAGQGKVNINLEVKSKDDVREFDKYGKKLRVCNAIVSDGQDDITLTLWNDDIEKVNVGQKIRIENGYVSEFQGKLQLSAGKFGKIVADEGSSREDGNEEFSQEKEDFEGEEGAI